MLKRFSLILSFIILSLQVYANESVFSNLSEEEKINLYLMAKQQQQAKQAEVLKQQKKNTSKKKPGKAVARHASLYNQMPKEKPQTFYKKRQSLRNKRYAARQERRKQMYYERIGINPIDDFYSARLRPDMNPRAFSSKESLSSKDLGGLMAAYTALQGSGFKVKR